MPERPDNELGYHRVHPSHMSLRPVIRGLGLSRSAFNKPQTCYLQILATLKSALNVTVKPHSPNRIFQVLLEATHEIYDGVTPKN